MYMAFFFSLASAVEDFVLFVDYHAAAAARRDLFLYKMETNSGNGVLIVI